MKFPRAALAALAIAVGATAAAASPEHSLGIGVGATVPTSHWTDVTRNGLQFGAQYAYRGGDWLGVGFGVKYQMPGVKSASETLDGVRYGARLRTHVWNAGPDVELFLPVKIAGAAPYLRAGLGLYSVTQKANLVVSDGPGSASIASTVNELEFGFDAGLGIRVATGGRTSLGIEALYHAVPMSNGNRLAPVLDSSGNAAMLGLFTLGLGVNFITAK